MKKLKLRSKELINIGFQDEDIPVIINIVKKHFKRRDKSDILFLLEDLYKTPKKYKNDPRLNKIAAKLEGPKKTNKFQTAQKTVEYKLDNGVKDYVIFGREYIEQEALQQMETAMRLPITVKGALMPDAHSGYGLPIGGVLATEKAIIPYGVGMDIGCRMCLSVYNISPAYLDNNRKKLKQILYDNTRFGQKDYFKEKKEHEVIDRNEFKEIKFLKDLKDKAYEQLGTSGSGNHFVEFGITEFPDKNDFQIPAGSYLAVLSHSGSRNFGASIAQHYTRLAKLACNLPRGATNLAWLELSVEEGIEYWQAMNLAGDYARANHQIIHQKITSALKEKPIFIVENHHNFAWKEKLENGNEAIVHRKGATPAIKGVYGVIPGSMTTPGFIVKGKGNSLSLNSASHGAGRQLSRAKAKERFTKKVVNEALKKAGVELIGGGLDEAPMAYKDIHKVMEFQKDIIEVEGVFYPKIVRMSGN